MKIVGCDLHARQQTMALVDTETGEFSEKTLAHEGNMVREFYAALDGPVGVGIEATGAMQWFLELLEQLGIECRVGHPAKIRGAETRQQKHDRRDARLELKLLVEDRFPTIWMPSIEQRDLRTLRNSKKSSTRRWRKTATFAISTLPRCAPTCKSSNATRSRAEARRIQPQSRPRRVRGAASYGLQRLAPSPY
jgi:hypothetical protein